MIKTSKHLEGRGRETGDKRRKKDVNLLFIGFALGAEREIMHNLKTNKKKNNTKVTATATKLFLLGAILIVASLSTASLGAQASRFETEGGG